MKAKRSYFPATTPQQRKLLFETWEQTGNVTTACRTAHVGRTTFYVWKPRFSERGYAGLETCEQVGVPVGTGRIAAEIQTKVVALHRANATWGKRRLADEMTKANNWVPLVSPNCVRRILVEAELWNPDSNRVKKGSAHR